MNPAGPSPPQTKATGGHLTDHLLGFARLLRRAGLPVGTDFAEFYRAFEWTGLQRHLKVLGIFARIRYRDGKPQYLEDAPRFVAYARAVSRRYRPLAPLARLLDEIEGVTPRAAFTF